MAIYEFSFFGFSIMIGILLYNLLSWFLFPYRNDTLIMVNNASIYSHETGFVKLEQIKKYTVNVDSMLLDLELKNNKLKSIKYNKFLDVELLKNELQVKLSGQKTGHNQIGG